MGVIERIFSFVFGGGGNKIVETVEVFRENAEAGATRDVQLRTQALAQHAGEFALERKGWFDRFMDGLNRLPRPALALGTLGLFIAAMVDPIWFAARMQGLSLVPEPLWWLLGAIVSFYFGARHQAKGQEFQRSIAQSMALAPQLTQNLRALRALEGAPIDLPASSPRSSDANPALADWQASRPLGRRTP